MPAPGRLASAHFLRHCPAGFRHAPAPGLGLFSQVLSPLKGTTSWQVEKLHFQRFSGLMALLYGALLPVQLIASGLFVQDLNTAERLRLDTLKSQQQRITERLAAAGSLAELNALIPPPPGQGGASLGQRQATIRQALANDQRSLARQLAQQRRQRLLSLAVNGLRILVTALASAFFFRMLAGSSDQLLARAMREATTPR